MDFGCSPTEKVNPRAHRLETREKVVCSRGDGISIHGRKSNIRGPTALKLGGVVCSRVDY